MLKYGKFCNKFFAEVVNTEINCMQVKKSVFRKRETQKSFLQQETHIKEMFACEYFPIQDTRVMGGHVLAS